MFKLKDLNSYITEGDKTYEYEELPTEVKDLLASEYDDDKSGDTAHAKELVDKLEEIGWTADFGLEGVLTDFKEL